LFNLSWSQNIQAQHVEYAVHNGQTAIHRILHLSGSFDHRVVDGTHGATFIQCVKDYLEFPATILS
jgi:pyruvate/2-oxoglutarate dehydrogenase complex dihydrolipoamide acyltransferase (E2) component